MQSNRDLLTAAYQAFNARDIDTVLALMHPDVDWPNGMEGGRVRGQSGVREYWLRQWAQIDPRVEPLGMADDEHGRTVVEVHQKVRDLDGKVLMDQTVQHVYTIQEGLIVRMEIRDPGGKLVS
jgi:ketosteroid isomerase-like protein